MSRTLRQRIDDKIEDINLLMDSPGYEELTSLQMRAKAQRMRSMATSAHLRGAQVKSEFDMIWYSACCSEPITLSGLCTGCGEACELSE